MSAPRMPQFPRERDFLHRDALASRESDDVSVLAGLATILTSRESAAAADSGLSSIVPGYGRLAAV